MEPHVERAADGPGRPSPVFGKGSCCETQVDEIRAILLL